MEKKQGELIRLIDVILIKYGRDSVQYKQHANHYAVYKKPEPNAMQKMLAELQGRKIK